MGGGEKKKKCCSALIHSGNVTSVHSERFRQNFKWKGETGSNLEKVLSYQSWGGLKNLSKLLLQKIDGKISLLKL